MKDTDREYIFLLEKRIDELEQFIKTEIVRLDKKADKWIEAYQAYCNQQLDERGQIYGMIRETTRVAYSAFYKTHPGVIQDMIEAEKITGKPEDKGRDPQP